MWSGVPWGPGREVQSSFFGRSVIHVLVFLVCVVQFLSFDFGLPILPVILREEKICLKQMYCCNCWFNGEIQGCGCIFVVCAVVGGVVGVVGIVGIVGVGGVGGVVVVDGLGELDYLNNFVF